VDWALSRERFWGTPLPVWTDGEGDYLCIGSLAELEQRSGRKLEGLDLHRPAVDAITFQHEGREYRRVAEVIDCWFDSGSMPYAQLHYPFENAEYFKNHFPADFISEAIDQTRGWFYTLHAIATMVMDSVAFRHVVCLSHLVDHDGRKMSKSLGNVVDPYAVFNSAGADPLRWYFAARVAPDAQKRLSVEIVSDVASSFLNTLWNVYSFLVMYARLDKIDFDDRPEYSRRSESDRWVLSLLEQTLDTATAAMDEYDALRAGTAIEKFVDQLSNWYVRLNRRRFWKATGGADKQSAYVTLYECLDAVARLIAPFMPFLSEALYQNLVRSLDSSAPLSVHMAEWPARTAERLDRALLDEIDIVQQVVALGRSARNDSRLKVRQPLSRIMVRAPGAAAAQAIARHAEQIQDELNVKAIEQIAQDAKLVTYRLKPNLPVVGKKYGKWIPALRRALAEADGAAVVATLAAGRTVQFQFDGETVELGSDGVLVETSAAEGFAFAEAGGYLVALDTHLTHELVLEGLAREVVRSVQEGRKQAGLNVSDRIALSVEGDANISEALAKHREYVMNETLAVEWRAVNDANAFSSEHSLNDTKWRIRLESV
jgi:isoleucyl-tRNA synthetase